MGRVKVTEDEVRNHATSHLLGGRSQFPARIVIGQEFLVIIRLKFVVLHSHQLVIDYGFPNCSALRNRNAQPQEVLQIGRHGERRFGIQRGDGLIPPPFSVLILDNGIFKRVIREQLNTIYVKSSIIQLLVMIFSLSSQLFSLVFEAVASLDPKSEPIKGG